MVSERMKTKIATAIQDAGVYVRIGYGFALATSEDNVCQVCMFNRATDVSLIRTTLRYKPWVVLMARCEICDDKSGLKAAARKYVHHMLSKSTYDGLRKDNEFGYRSAQRRRHGDLNRPRA
jgi:hypothetical protein